jgi:predicted PolB exonuclease-like 3'-5' exonuclease
MSNILAFNVKTIPNIQLGKKIYNLSDLDDDDISKVMFFKQRQENKTDVLPLYLHKVVAISTIIKTNKEIQIISLGKNGYDEKNMVQQFFEEVERYQPKLISWNGRGFDMPILYIRAMNYKIQAKHLLHNLSSDLKSNICQGKYDESHTDLIDILPTSQSTSRVSLHSFASLLGVPCVKDTEITNIWNTFLTGGDKEIRNDCDMDVVKIYLIFLRLQHFRGYLSGQQLDQSNDQFKDYLTKSSKPHLFKFLEAWNSKS